MRRRSTSAARSFGTGSGPAARTFGRAGGGVVSYDGMIWDQTYGDFGTYEEAQITTAAKGADAMNPGLTMNLVVKSGSNTFKGLGSANYQSGDFQSDNVTHGAAGQGLCARRQQVHQAARTSTAKSAGRSCKDRLWFYASHRDASSGNFIPGLRPASPIASRWSSTPSCRIRPARSPIR